MQIVVDEQIVTYTRSGSGASLVLLHGWGDTSSTFDKLGSKLSIKYDVIAVDLPGFGGTKAPLQAWGLDDYAHFVKLFVTKLGLTSVYAYIGHSNGGAIAIRGLAKGDLHAKRLVLLASAGVRSEDKTKKKAIRLLTKTAKIATKPLPKRLQYKLKKRAYAAIGSDLFVAESMQDTFKKIVNDDVQSDATKITVPTLLIYGEKDHATPIRWGRKLHDAIAGSDYVVIPDIGHFVHHEQVELVASSTLEFLQ